MPRVKTKTKNKAGKPYDCGRCDKKITPGQSYYTWAFRYGGVRRQHVEHGAPRRGQLTQSKLGAVYDAVDDAEESIGSAGSADEIAGVISSVRDTVDEVKEEYEDACEAMGAAGESGTSREYADELESFSSELDSAESEIQGETFEADKDATKKGEGDEDRNADGETESEWLEKLRETATDALGALGI